MSENNGPVTFRELRIGDKFIPYPSEGDTRYGDMVFAHAVFIKIATMTRIDTGEEIDAIKLSDADPRKIPPELPVIKIGRS